MIRQIEILKKIYGFFLDIVDYIICLIYKSPKVLSVDETLEKIISNNLSVARFGDGEFTIIKNKDKKGLRFQNNDENLSRMLKKVLNSDNNNLLVGIPKVFGKEDLDKMTKESKNFWKKYIRKNRLKLYKYLDINKVYADSFFTRQYIMLEDKSECKYYFEKVKKIWNKRDVIIIEGKFTRIGVGNDLLNNCNSIKRIIAPAENAFASYKKIIKEVKKYKKEKYLILIALGPTATVLAYELSLIGYQAIDIGHIDIEYEWFIKGVKEKVAVENKYTNEAKCGTDNLSDDIFDKEYINQIVSKINI